MLELFTLLYILLSEQHEAKKTTKETNRDFLWKREELYRIISARAVQNSCQIFKDTATNKEREEFNALIDELLDEGILDLRNGRLRIGNKEAFEDKIKKHDFAKFCIGVAGVLFPTDPTSEP